MYNDIIAGITIAGTFFTAGFIGAVWDFKRAQRKKAREQKIKLAYEALDAGVEEVMQEGVNNYLSSLAEARKHSYSDNDWSMADVL
ncbi:hypothetical protein DW052_08785 [Streptococcus parasanguinis]|jgi:hypothetical protein|nr:hypothetical protein DW052_08785 [Streptococcus parasanguinis]